MKSLAALRKNKKGFTLVEVIVVLVILAILAAILVPTLTGYIDKANERTLVANCRSAVMAAQTLASEYYGKASSTKPTQAMVETLAELPTGTVTWTYPDDGKVTTLTYKEGTKTCTYTKDLTTGKSTYAIS